MTLLDYCKDTLYFVKCSHIVVARQNGRVIYLLRKERNKLSKSARALCYEAFSVKLGLVWWPKNPIFMVENGQVTV